MLKFLPLVFVFSCAAPQAAVSKEYAAAIDVGCFLYGLQNTIDAQSAKQVAGRCTEGMTQLYIKMQAARGTR